MPELYNWQDEVDRLNESADRNIFIGRLMTYAAFPLAAASGITLSVLEKQYLYGFDMRISHLPQDLLVALPPLLAGFGGLFVKSDGQLKKNQAESIV